MKTTLVLLIVLGVGGLTASDFRGLNWGDGPVAVKCRELSNPVSMDGDRLEFDGKLGEQSVGVHYQFVGGKLAQGVYLIRGLTGAEAHSSRYGHYLEALTLKYGLPHLQEDRWRPGVLLSGYRKREAAIEVGDLAMHAVWQTKRTRINLYLGVQGGVRILAVGYTSRALENNLTLGLLGNVSEVSSSLAKSGDL
jgi:hypothetical protein